MTKKRAKPRTTTRRLTPTTLIIKNACLYIERTRREPSRELKTCHCQHPAPAVRFRSQSHARTTTRTGREQLSS